MLSENIFYFGAVFGGDFFKRPLLRSRTSFTPLRRSHIIFKKYLNMIVYIRNIFKKSLSINANKSSKDTCMFLF